jgi:hypothetical protein
MAASGSHSLAASPAPRTSIAMMKSDCYLQHVMRIRELQEYVKEVRGLYGLREEKREGRREEGVME